MQGLPSCINEKKVFFKNKRGQKLTGILELPVAIPKAFVIYVHGRVSTKQTQKVVELAKFLVPKGFAFLRFDCSGCGESEGSEKDLNLKNRIEDLESALFFIKQFNPQKIGLCGNSLGAAVVLTVAANANIDCVVSFGTPTNSHKAEYKNVLNSIKKINCPILFIHSELDEEIPLLCGKEAFKDANEPKRIIFVKDANHRISDSTIRTKVIKNAAIWFKKWLA
ncbi:MAG: alpha/beta hydrolase [Candidatus Diapherotrites archaeon]|nr:alpha/beta hydrolase [Candidatus Diapherotrites archaeon]